MKDPKTMSMTELVAAYNKLSGKKAIKKFRSKADGVAKVNKLVAGTGKPTKVESKPAAKGNGAGRPRKLIDWPYEGPGNGEPSHKIREGTLNDQFIKVLGKGATEEELTAIVTAHDKATGKTSKDAMSTRVRQILRMLHTYNGYGIKQTGERYRLLRK